MMKLKNNLQIDSLSALHSERAALRKRANALELEISTHYKTIAGNLKPILSVIQKANIIKQKFTFLTKDNPGDTPSQKFVKKLLPAASIIASGIILRSGQKIFIKSVVGYGIGTATKYLLSKSINEHKESVQNIFKSKKERIDGIF